jgi:hypothetical protein
MVDALTRWPSLSNSPWIFLYPRNFSWNSAIGPGGSGSPSAAGTKLLAEVSSEDLRQSQLPTLPPERSGGRQAPAWMWLAHM